MKTLFFLIFLVMFIKTISYEQANTTLSNLASPTSINQSLQPNNNNLRDLGSASKSWRTLYIDSSIYLKDALFIQTRGTQNIFIGEGAGTAITTGVNNSVFGFHAMYTNKINSANTAIGNFALFKNRASNNTAVGFQAMYSNTTATLNTAIGYQALYSNTTGSPNTAVGWGALYSNTTGIENTAIGQGALYQNVTGNNNVAVGRGALFSSELDGNTAVGFKALFYSTTGDGNTATGYQALTNDVDGFSNTAIGYSALITNTNGGDNTAVGFAALANSITGFNNTAVGVLADVDLSNSSANTIIGPYAHISGSNSVVVGYNSYTNTNNLALLGNTTTAFCGGYVNWTNYASDKRLKTQVKENVKGLDFIMRLRPVTYHLDLMNLYKIQGISPYGKQADKMTTAMKTDIDNNIKNKEAVLMSGFIAQEVEQAAKESGYDFDGVKKPQNDKDNYGLSYATFVVPLVKAVQELSKMNDDLQTKTARIDELENEVNELKQMVQSFVQTKSFSAGDSYLNQNIPNPSNGKTVIPFHIAKGSHLASIQIAQTASGKIIKTIMVDVNATQVSVITNSFAVGNYTYSLFVDGNISDSKQITLSGK